MIRAGAIIFVLLTAGLAGLVSGDRGGRLLLALDRPATAAMVLRDPAWRGIALDRAGRPAEAARVLRTTRSPEAAYNLGNALARAGQPALAVKAYDIALRRDPDDADARANRDLVLALLRPPAASAPGKASGEAGATANRETSNADMGGDDPGPQSSSGDGAAGQREAGASADKAGASRVDRRGDAAPGMSEAGLGASKGAASDSAGRAGRGGGMTTAATSEGARPPEAAAAPAAETGQATAQWLASLPDDPARFLRLRIAAEHQRRLEAGTAPRRAGSPW